MTIYNYKNSSSYASNGCMSLYINYTSIHMKEEKRFCHLEIGRKRAGHNREKSNKAQLWKIQQKLVKKRLGPRWWDIWTGASLKAHCNTLAAKWHAHRLTIKGQKVGSGPSPGNPNFLPQNSWDNSLTCWPMKWPRPRKWTTPYPGATLTFWDGPLSVECVSL